MSTKQGVTLASRILTVYFLTLCAYRISDLPIDLMSLFHNQAMQGVSTSSIYAQASDSYYYRISIEAIGHSALIIALDLMMALIFYRCGPKVARFLLGAEISPTEESARNEAGAARG